MKIYWLINGDVQYDPVYGAYNNLASNRLRCLVPASILTAQGYQIEVVTNATYAHSITLSVNDVVIVGKLFNNDYSEFLQQAAGCGARIILDFCDPVWSRQPYVGYREYEHELVFASEGLRRSYVEDDVRATTVIGDPFELPQSTDIVRATRHSNLLWYGNVFNIDPLYQLLDDIEGQTVQVVTALDQELCNRLMDKNSRNNVMFTPWSMRSLDNALRYTNSIVVIPHYKRKGYELKSSNRLVTAIAAGHVVIAESAPQWEEFRQFNMLTDSVAGSIWGDEWLKVRPRDQKAAYNYVLERYSPIAIAKQWEGVINADPA